MTAIVARKSCPIKTAHYELFGRHLSRMHEVKRKSLSWIHDYALVDLVLQSGDKHSACDYWALKADRPFEAVLIINLFMVLRRVIFASRNCTALS
jgi:hypothetical protein